MTITYSLADNDGGKFAIDPSTGVVTTAAGLTGVAGTTQNITVRASDGFGWFKDTVIPITVTASFNSGKVSNGTFSSGLSPWTSVSNDGTTTASDSSVISVVAGRLQIANAPGHIYSSASILMTGLTIGATYTLSLNIQGNSAGAPAFVRVSNTALLPNTGTFNSGDITSAGTYTNTFVASATSHYLGVILNTSSASALISIDNVSVL